MDVLFASLPIQRGFNGINPDRRIQAILVSFTFGAFIEGAAGTLICGD